MNRMKILLSAVLVFAATGSIARISVTLGTLRGEIRPNSVSKTF